MPLDKKSAEMERSFEASYGPEEGKRNFYATLNKRINEGRPVKVGESKHLKAKRKHAKAGKRKMKRRGRR